MKGKLVMSLYKAAKPSSTNSFVQYRTKVKRNNDPSSITSAPKTSTTTTVGFNVDQDQYAVPNSSTRKLSMNSSSSLSDAALVHDMNYSRMYAYDDMAFGGGVGEENIDSRAASYISCVQERFRLDM
ncbi:hypothetical protein Scep_018215 [Stephania cephalantha]|uniref:Uncharacterized protein n=1 Tax=Stephania cephalantha TaxID=152367 RepID=A0AAP0ISX1_9MAGN